MFNPSPSPMTRSKYSRRDLLKTLMGAAAASHCVHPFLAGQHLPAPIRAIPRATNPATGIWDLPMPLQAQLTCTPVLDRGTVWAAGNVSYDVDYLNAGLNIFQLDMQTFQPVRNPVRIDSNTDTPIDYLIVPPQNIMYKRADTIAYQFLGDYVGLVAFTDTLGAPFVHGDVCVAYWSLGSQPQAFSVSTWASIWNGPTIPGARTVHSTLTTGGIFLMATDGLLTAMDFQTGAQYWKTAYPGTPSGLCVSGGFAYVTVSTGHLLSFDLENGAAGWVWPSGQAIANPLSAPVAYCNTIYFGDSVGSFYAVDTVSKTSPWSLPLTPGIDQGKIFIEDGAAYISAVQSGGSTIYAVDLTNPSAAPVTYSAGSNGRVLSVDNGICYIAHNDGKNIAAANFADQLHEFFCDSSLMADDVAGAPASVTPANPVFNTHIQLLDQNRNPRVKKSVKLWAADTVTVTAGGQSYTLSPTNSVGLATDPFGELSLKVTADDISCPALYLWADFMDPQEAMMIFPDHHVMTYLSTVNEGDITGAVGFDNQPMLPGYTPDNASALAQTLSNTIGGMTQSSALTARSKVSQRRRRETRKSPVTRQSVQGQAIGSDTTYIAYPGSSPTLAYNANVSQNAAVRTHQPGTVPTFTTYITGTGVKFSAGIADHIVSDAVGIEATSSLGLSDFVHAVVKGARTVVRVVVETTDKVVHTVYDDLKNVYTITVTAIEHAAAVVSGVLKSVVGDIKKAVEWLAYLFDWKDILATKETIKQTAIGNLQKLSSWVGQADATAIGEVQSVLQSLSSQLKNDISGLDSMLRGSTMKDRQPNQNDPSTVYNHNGAQSYPQSRWGTGKVTDNAAGMQDTTVSLSAAGAPAGFNEAVDAITNAIRLRLADARYASLEQDVLNFLKNFGNLMTNPVRFVENTLADVVDIVGDVAVLVLQLVCDVLTAVMQNFQVLMSTAIDLVANHVITIPVVDDLWKVISGDSLTMLDLIALVVAIPSTIINKVSQSTQLAASSTSAGLIGIADILNGTTGAIFDAFGDLEDAAGNSGLSRANMATTTIGLGLSVGSTLDTGSFTPWSIAFLVLSAVPLIMSAVTHYADSRGPAWKAVWSKDTPTHNAYYGIAMLGLSIGLGVHYPSQFRNPNDLTLVSNLFSYFPYFAKFFATGPAFNDARIGVSIIDGACETTAAILSGVVLFGE